MTPLQKLMSPIILLPPIWPPMKDGETSVAVGHVLLRVRQHPRHPSDLRWVVLVSMGVVAAPNGYYPMNLEEAQSEAWNALGKWLGVT